ncbi:hypothetical protein [Rhodococcus baikonurensis]|uniref:Uncharacterized protein n=1 Tax=Rhodococcus baikonurensis TaxID=172041 RepID=A0ABV5XVH1_9NOCA
MIIEVNDIERVIRDLRAEDLDPTDYDIDGIVADLRAQAPDSDEMTSPATDLWVRVLRKRLLPTVDEAAAHIVTHDKSLLDRLRDMPPVDQHNADELPDDPHPNPSR